MLAWFTGWLERLVKLGLDLAFALISGVLSAPFRAARGAEPPVVRAASASEVVDVRHRVLRASEPRSAAVFSGDTAPTTRHWVAERAGAVVGVVSVLAAPMPPEPPIDGGAARPEMQLRGMAVLPEVRGQHLGEALLLAAHAGIAAPMWCNARAAVVPFYARFGWKPAGPLFEIAGIGPHQRMWWSGPT